MKKGKKEAIKTMNGLEDIYKTYSKKVDKIAKKK